MIVYHVFVINKKKRKRVDVIVSDVVVTDDDAFRHTHKNVLSSRII